MSISSKTHQFSKLIANAKFTAAARKLSSEKGTRLALDLLRDTHLSGGCIYLVGNGGSAAVASHAITDLVNAAGYCARVLHEPSLLTCLSNDHGYENAYARVLKGQAKKEDLLIAISSSGKSRNILNAAKVMRRAGGRLMTLTGFNARNPLRQKGDLNIWLDSTDYGPVEIGHLFILHFFSDLLVVYDKKK